MAAAAAAATAALHALWHATTLSAHRRPVYVADETELLCATHVSLYYGPDKVYRDGVAFLTTHRVIWMPSLDATDAYHVHLSFVQAIETKAGFIGVSSPKILVHVHGVPQLVSAATFDVRTGCCAVHVPNETAKQQSQQSPSPLAPVLIPPEFTPAPSPGFFQLSFKSDRRDEFHDKLKYAIAAQPWIAARPVERPKTETFSTFSAGVGGIIRTIHHNTQKTDAALEQAFTDLRALMDNAREIVQLADRFAQSTATTRSQADDDTFSSLLTDMGIPNPVTKRSAGSAFHQLLARQLAEFLDHWLARQRVPRADLMMTLTDLYCVYNRARGTELISPDDLLTACRMFGALALPYKIQSLQHNVMAVCDASLDTTAHAQRIADALRTASPQSAATLSATLHRSLIWLEPHLQHAEQTGLIVRDESVVDCILWYPNRFFDLHPVCRLLIPTSSATTTSATSVR